MIKHTNSPDTFEIELRTEILQFLAEYHQGLNELNGNGTAIEQFIKSLTVFLKSKIPKKKESHQYNYEDEERNIGYNQAIDDITKAFLGETE